eukprot:756685-Pleurochrysis_carterae.AAC.2
MMCLLHGVDTSAHFQCPGVVGQLVHARNSSFHPSKHASMQAIASSQQCDANSRSLHFNFSHSIFCRDGREKS